jgi:hypothetical protein
MAEAHFRRGLKEMKAGNYAVGCPALAESERLDPRPGTLFTLADCEARWGKVATASAHYEDYLTRVSHLSGRELQAHKERIAIAKARLEEIGPKIPQLTLVLPKDAPSGTEVRRDDVLLGAPSIGVPLSIDPGPHTVTTKAPGGAAHAHTVELAEGQAKTLELVVDEKAMEPAVTTAPTIEPPPESAPPPAPPSKRRTIGLVVGGVGVLGVAVGAIAGGVVLGQKSAVDRDCPNAACHGDGMNEVSRLKTTAMVSNVSFGVGGGLLAIGAVLFLTAPSSSSTQKKESAWKWTPAVGQHEASIGLGRAW